MIIIQRKGAFVLTALIKRGEGTTGEVSCAGQDHTVQVARWPPLQVCLRGNWRFSCTVAYLGEGGKLTMADLQEEAAEPIFFLQTVH